MDFGKARKSADESLSAQGLDNLVKLDLSSAFPAEADRVKVSGLIEKIKSVTAQNERIAAIKAIAATLTADGAAALKKALLALLVIFTLGAGVARAEEAPMLDFGSFFMRSRLGYSIDQHMERSTVLYSAFKRYNVKPGVELANLNFGYDTSNKHPVVMIGIRLDNADRLLWSGDWAKKHIESAPLPVIEFGPDIKAWPRVESGKVHLDYWYGFTLAMGVK